MTIWEGWRGGGVTIWEGWRGWGVLICIMSKESTVEIKFNTNNNKIYSKTMNSIPNA